MNRFSVREAYAGKSILITGATGFLGRVLVEKLLRDVTDLKSIYFFLRPKRGQNFDQRLAEFKSSPVFQRVLSAQPKALEKLIPIRADILTTPKLGISEKDLDKMRENVNFVVHAAATVKFDEPLEVAMKTNTLPSRTLLDIAKTFDNLESYIQVSTAFANTHRPSLSSIEEIIYDPVYDYKKALNIIEGGNHDDIQKLEEFGKSFPNTYTFSKYLVEQMIREKYSDLPVTIVRPSIITPTLREPSVAWVNFSGTVMAVQLATSQGILKNIFGKKDSVLDYIPCDLIVNSLIAAGAEMASNSDKSLRVYQCTIGKQTPITFEETMKFILENSRTKFPSTQMVSYPKIRMTDSKIVCQVNTFFFQIIPSILFDFFRLVQLKKPFYLKVQKRIGRVMENELNYFTSNGWNFDNSKLLQLYDSLTPEDR